MGSSCAGDSVARQTALGNVNDKREWKVRVLFDSGSHRSFITSRAAKALDFKPVRREGLMINAFGCKETKEKERCCRIESYASEWREDLKISCIIVESIAYTANVHAEKVKTSYEHLQMI